MFENVDGQSDWYATHEPEPKSHQRIKLGHGVCSKSMPRNNFFAGKHTLM